jgi:hypothetical protein
MTAPIIVSGEGLLVPTDRPYWTSPEMFNQRYGRPSFTKREVAQFFGRSVTWLVHFALDHVDEEIGPVEPLKTSGGRKRWTLHQIELLAHLNLRAHQITVDHFSHIINIIKSTATMYGYDVGDPRYRMLWYVEDDPGLVHATHLVTERLTRKASPPTTEAERLAETAAWAVDKLRQHLEGLKT